MLIYVSFSGDFGCSFWSGSCAGKNRTFSAQQEMPGIELKVGAENWSAPPCLPARLYCVVAWRPGKSGGASPSRWSGVDCGLGVTLGTVYKWKVARVPGGKNNCPVGVLSSVFAVPELWDWVMAMRAGTWLQDLVASWHQEVECGDPAAFSQHSQPMPTSWSSAW